MFNTVQGFLYKEGKSPSEELVNTMPSTTLEKFAQITFTFYTFSMCAIFKEFWGSDNDNRHDKLCWVNKVYTACLAVILYYIN